MISPLVAKALSQWRDTFAADTVTKYDHPNQIVEAAFNAGATFGEVNAVRNFELALIDEGFDANCVNAILVRLEYMGVRGA